jgi:hypothetical protein
MANITTVANYVGKFEIFTNGANTAKLTDFITRYEEGFLVDLLGVDFYNVWRADIDGGSPSAANLFIYNAFNYQGGNNCLILKSRGVEDMLLGFIYFEYLRDLKTQQTISGGVKIKGENSSRAGYSNTRNRYNESVDTYQDIQAYICDNLQDYPDFNGVSKSLTIF